MVMDLAGRLLRERDLPPVLPGFLNRVMLIPVLGDVLGLLTAVPSPVHGELFKPHTSPSY